MKLRFPFLLPARIGWSACFLVVWISAFSLSGTQRPPLELDPSWNAVIEYATAHHWQFGTQIVFTFGPLGFLAAPTSLGQMVGVRIAFAFFWSVVVALTATTVAKRLPGWSRYAFLSWLILFTLAEGLDQTAFWVLASVTLLLLMEGPRPRWQAPLFVAVLVVLGLIKASFFTAGIVSLTLVTGCWLWRGKSKAAVSLVMGATAGFVAGWSACGQSVSHLVPWIKTNFELESGYSGAMNLTPKTAVLCLALSALLLFNGALVTMAARGRANLLSWAAAITLAQFGFLAWKEGFTRCGDWHAFVFLWFLPLGLSFFLLEGLPGALPRARRWPFDVAFAAGIALCLAAAQFQIPGFAWQQIREWPPRWVRNASAIARSMSGNGDALYAGSRDAQLSRMLVLDHAYDVVGNESVDVLNYLQTAALLNGMNYQPRPVFQGFVAYTPALQRLNEAYFESTERPHFVMLAQQATDGRFPALEDSSTLNYVLNNYVPVARDGRFLILHQQTANSLQFQLKQETTLHFGEELNLRPWASGPLFMTVAINPNLLGSAVQTMYQLQPLSMRIVTARGEEHYRIVPSMAERPFLASPVLDGNFDVMNLFTSQPGKQLESITLERPPHGSFEFQEAIVVRLYTAPGFPLAAGQVSAPRILADVQGRAFFPVPASVESATPARTIIFHGTAALKVTAPSKINVDIPANALSFSGYVGVPEEAYAGGFKSGGVAISIVVRDGSGQITAKIERVLAPSTRADDRGRFPFSLPINRGRDRTVTLSTGTSSVALDNESGSVWSNCRFEELKGRRE